MMSNDDDLIDFDLSKQEQSAAPGVGRLSLGAGHSMLSRLDGPEVHAEARCCCCCAVKIGAVLAWTKPSLYTGWGVEDCVGCLC